jgi:hypothetical protein
MVLAMRVESPESMFQDLIYCNLGRGTSIAILKVAKEVLVRKGLIS